MKSHTLLVVGASLIAFGIVPRAETKMVTDHNPNPTAGFRFNNVPAPSGFDAATKARFIVIDAHASVIVETPAAQPVAKTFEAEGGKYQFTIDTSAAPDLTKWAAEQLAPVVQEWYPKLVKMLPSEGYEAPTRVSITFKDGMRVPAAAGGSRISCNSDWFRRNLNGEARGSVVHEMVHVVQQYGRVRRDNPNATRPPGWLVEASLPFDGDAVLQLKAQ